MKGLPRKGLCECGHLRWKEHKWSFEDRQEICLGCKKCDCKDYFPTQTTKHEVEEE